MTILKFPSADCTHETGVLALGGRLDVESMLLAFRQGIYPMSANETLLSAWEPVERHVMVFDRDTTESDGEAWSIIWMSPSMRGILALGKFRPSKDLCRAGRKNNFTFQINSSFQEVIAGCSALTNRKSQVRWITPMHMKAFNDIYESGYAYSVEAFHDGILAGGFFGIFMGRMFSITSMFYRKSYASKLAVWYFAERLRKLGVRFIDIQTLSPHFAEIGAEEMPRDAFAQILSEEINCEQICLAND